MHLFGEEVTRQFVDIFCAKQYWALRCHSCTSTSEQLR